MRREYTSRISPGHHSVQHSLYLVFLPICCLVWYSLLLEVGHLEIFGPFGFECLLDFDYGAFSGAVTAKGVLCCFVVGQFDGVLYHVIALRVGPRNVDRVPTAASTFNRLSDHWANPSFTVFCGPLLEILLLKLLELLRSRQVILG